MAKNSFVAEITLQISQRGSGLDKAVNPKFCQVKNECVLNIALINTHPQLKVLSRFI